MKPSQVKSSRIKPLAVNGRPLTRDVAGIQYLFQAIPSVYKRFERVPHHATHAGLSMERSPTDVAVKLKKVLLAARPDCRHVHMAEVREGRGAARRERGHQPVRVSEEECA
jgi:hypothetical protein